MSRFHTLTAVALLAPTLAFAAPPSPKGAPAAAPAERDARREERHEEHREEMVRRMRLARTVGMADALGLDEAGALDLSKKLKPFDERRESIAPRAEEARKTIKRAAEGDATALQQLEPAIAAVFETRAEMERIDREMVDSLGKGMQPQQKAKLLVFLATFRHEMGRGGGKHGGHGGDR